jgi:hypothetical protein
MLHSQTPRLCKALSIHKCKTYFILISSKVWTLLPDTPKQIMKHVDQKCLLACLFQTSRLPGPLQINLVVPTCTYNNQAQNVCKFKRTSSKKIGSLAQVQYRRSSSISFKAPLRAPRDYFHVKRIGTTEGQTSSPKIHNWYVPPPPVYIRSKCDLGNHSSNGWCCVEGGQRGPAGSSCALIN